MGIKQEGCVGQAGKGKLRTNYYYFISIICGFELLVCTTLTVNLFIDVEFKSC